MSSTTGAQARRRVAVMYGGRSAEHEISLLSARFVVEMLDRRRYEPVLVGIDRHGRWRLQSEATLLSQPRDPREVALDPTGALVRLEAHPSGAHVPGSSAVGRGRLVFDDGESLEIDAVFPVLHGPHGEDGCIQGLFALADVPFVGAGVLGSAVGMDKDVMKRLLREAGLPIVAHRTLRASVWSRDRDAVLASLAALGLPCFVKPANLGSSVGVSMVREAARLGQALDEAFSYDEKVVVESAVPGVRELECAVLGGDPARASVVGEIVVDHPDGFYSYAAKYVDEHGATTLVPAMLEPDEERRVRELALACFDALECEGLARVDFFRAETGELYLNEINTLPGFTAISMYPKLWEASGIGGRALVEKLLALAFERAERRARLRTAV
jgi:D-alanine-D-alanine ligase